MLPVFPLVLALAGTPPPSGPTPPPGPTPVVLDRIAAVVGDEIILESEVRRLLDIGLHPRKPGETGQQLCDRILAERIDDLLRERQLRKTGGLEPDKAAAEQEMARLVARVEKEQGKPFDEVLARARVSREDVAAWIRRDLTLQTYVRERIAPTVKVTEDEVREYYEGPELRALLEKNGTPLPQLASIKDSIEIALRERKLNQEIDRWTAGLREKTRVLIYRRGTCRATDP